MIPEVRAEIKRRQAWRAYYMSVLDLWAHAAEAGYPASGVKAFTFATKFLDNWQKRSYTLGSYRKHFNCVRLHTGELQQIPMIEKPEKPDGDDPTEGV
jgi:hypothetical protein